MLAFGDSGEDAQLLKGHAVIVTAKMRGQASTFIDIFRSCPDPTVHTDWGLHRPGSGVADSAQATTRSLGWDESHLADGIIMRESKPCAQQSHHGCRLKALLCAGAESWPAAPAMDLRLRAPLLVRVPRNDGRVDRFNDFADPFDSCFATKILPKPRPSSAKSSASS